MTRPPSSRRTSRRLLAVATLVVLAACDASEDEPTVFQTLPEVTAPPSTAERMLAEMDLRVANPLHFVRHPAPRAGIATQQEVSDV